MTVGQAVKLSAASASGGRVKLTAQVLPGKAGQTVRFQRRAGGSWVTIGTVKAGASFAPEAAAPSYTWAAPAGTSTVRAVAPATAANAAGTSKPVTVRR